MNNRIFRQKSIKQMQSPDNLKEYIKVVNPGIWIVFIATLLLLAGAFIWGTFGKIEDKVSITAISQNGTVQCEYNNTFEKDMPVFIGENEGTVVESNPTGTTIKMKNALVDGVYSGYVVVGTITPMSFIFN